MSELPKGWSTSSLGDITVDIQGGGTPSKSIPENFAGSIPFMTVKDMKSFRPSDTRDKITETALQSCSSKLIPAGTPIVCTRMGLGKIVIVNFSTSINQDLKAVFLEKQLISTQFFEYWYRSIAREINSMGTGTTVKGITLKQLKELQVPLPPIAEQTRITHKLDELLAQVDTLKARIDAMPALLERFRQSILVSAVSGKLTEDWRSENTVSDLGDQITQILNDRSFSSKSKKPPASHLKSEEYDIPKTWSWVSLDSLSAKIVDGTHHTPTYVSHGVPFISVKDIRAGLINFNNTKFITPEEHSELSKRCNPEEGDLLITKSGTIGRTAIVPKTQAFSLFVSVALIKPASKLVNMKFVNIALRRWVNSIDISSRIVGSAIKNLHLTDMKVLAIPFAPTSEQAEIVRRVDKLFTLANLIENKIISAKSRIDHMTQSILVKALRGELVPQDPNDESIKILMQQIQSQRATTAKKNVAAKRRA